MAEQSFWTDKKVLVAGGAGFIGAHLVRLLLEAGATVRVADNLERGRRENLTDIWDRIEFMQVDLMSIDNCLDATQGQDVVMNLVARSCGVEYSQDHHGELFARNTMLGLNVLDAARQNAVERVLVVSTSAVYQDGVDSPTPETAYTGIPEQINQGYALGKINMERQAQYYTKEYGMKIAIARPANVYGRGDSWQAEKSHVIPALIKRILDGENPLLVWGSGEQTRSFVHVRDAARAFMELTEKHAVGEPVNVGHDREISIGDLARMICEQAGKSPEVQFDTTKPEGAPRKALSALRLKEVTGFQTEIPLQDGLKEMIDWFRDHYQEATTGSTPQLTIVTPVYNEDELIIPTIEEIKRNVRVPFEILVVYDYDEDTTIPFVQKMMPSVPELKLVKNNIGRGVINAVRTGIAEARGEYIVMVNGDLSDEMSTINTMVARANDGFDIVCGTRYTGGGKKYGGPFVQDLLSRLANASFYLLTRFPTSDVTNSFKLYRAEFLKNTKIESTGGFEFSMEMTIKGHSRGLKICDIPTIWKQRKGGESKFQLIAWLRNYLRWYAAGCLNVWFGIKVKQ